jgi:hypothetical protein
MKILKLLVLSAVILMATVGASHGAPASITPATPTPSATYPLNGALVTNYASGINFAWSASAGTGVKYRIDIATDAAFTNIIDGTTITPPLNIITPSFSSPSPSSTFGSFSPGTWYFWRVAAYANGAWSVWAVFSFRTSVATPALITPIPNAILENNLTNDVANDTSNDPVTFPVLKLFSWSSILGAEGYTLQVSQSALFNSFVINVTLPYTITSYSPTTDLPANTTLYWRVETLNSIFGPSVWAPIQQFTTANPPGIPTSLQPASGKVDNDFTPGLFWNVVGVPGGTTFSFYDVQISTDKKFETPTALCFDDETNSITQSNPTLDVQNAALPAPLTTDCPTFNDSTTGILSLQPATTYYWRVRAVGSPDGGINFFWSDWSSVNTLLMSYPQVDSAKFIPPDGTKLTTNSQSFSWKPPFVGSGAVPGTFALQIFKSQDFRTGAVVNLTKNGPGYIPVKPLPACTILYWRVRAGSSNSLYGSGPWSNSATIYTACPPSVPVPYSPKPGTVVNINTPTLKWQISVVPFGYTFNNYEIEITPDKNFGYIPSWGDIPITNQFPPSFTLSPLSHGTYYWRIRACDQDSAATVVACSLWSTAFYFKY